MSRKHWTAEDDNLLKQLYPDNKTSELLHLFNCSIGSIYRRAYTLNINKSESYLKAELQRQAERLKIVGAPFRIRKGNIPLNKGKKQKDYMKPESIERCRATMFKKGNLPHNTNKEGDGAISIRHDHKLRDGKPYKFIRLSLGKWHPLHQHIWEKEHGKYPDGYCLWFKDGNSLNCELSNLELITRAENMLRNSIKQYPEELQTSIKLINKIKKKLSHGSKKQTK